MCLWGPGGSWRGKMSRYDQNTLYALMKFSKNQ